MWKYSNFDYDTYSLVIKNRLFSKVIDSLEMNNPPNTELKDKQTTQNQLLENNEMDYNAIIESNKKNISKIESGDFFGASNTVIQLSDFTVIISEGAFSKTDFFIDEKCYKSKIDFKEFTNENNDQFCEFCTLSEVQKTDLINLILNVPTKDMLLLELREAIQETVFSLYYSKSKTIEVTKNDISELLPGTFKISQSEEELFKKMDDLLSM